MNIIKMNKELSINSIYVLKNGKRKDLRDCIDYTDKKTLKFLATGKFLYGIFQLNKEKTSGKMLMEIIPLLLKLLKDKQLTESKVILALSDINSLIRPACKESGAYDRYLKRLKGEYVEHVISESSPFYNITMSATKDSYQELLYQEQIIEVLEQIFDISTGKADTYRRLFEKKKELELKELKIKFWNIWKFKATVEQCAEFWNYLLQCSGYGFCLSHSVSYCYITFQTAYIKTHKEILLASIIHYYIGKLDKVKGALLEAVKLGIEIIIPKFNHCYLEAIPDIKKKAIYIPLNAIKGIGENVFNVLSRKNDFETVGDFLFFARNNGVNKSVIQILIKLNFFSEFFKTKKEAWSYIESYECITIEDREKKLIKKYNGYVYKPKKYEELIGDIDFNEGKCQVRIKHKLYDFSSKQTKENDATDGKKYIPINTNDILDQFKQEQKYLGYPISSILDFYDKELESNEMIIVVERVHSKQKSFDDGRTFSWTTIYDIYEESYYYPLVELQGQILNGTVLKIKLGKNKKGDVQIKEHSILCIL